MEDNTENNLNIVQFGYHGIPRFYQATWYTQATDHFYFITDYNPTVQPWSI